MGAHVVTIAREGNGRRVSCSCGDATTLAWYFNALDGEWLTREHQAGATFAALLRRKA
jgi:hypothetical protein